VIVPIMTYERSTLVNQSGVYTQNHSVMSVIAIFRQVHPVLTCPRRIQLDRANGLTQNYSALTIRYPASLSGATPERSSP